MTDKQTTWEERFDKKFNGYWQGEAVPDEIKFFIKSIIQEEREKAKKEVIDMLFKNLPLQ